MTHIDLLFVEKYLECVSVEHKWSGRGKKVNSRKISFDSCAFDASLRDEGIERFDYISWEVLTFCTVRSFNISNYFLC